MQTYEVGTVDLRREDACYAEWRLDRPCPKERRAFKAWPHDCCVDVVGPRSVRPLDLAARGLCDTNSH